MAISQIISVLFAVHQQVQLYHWRTRIFARHEASGKLYNALTPLIDRFVEVYIGSHQEDAILEPEHLNIILENVDDNRIVVTLLGFKAFLEKIIPRHLVPVDTDLLTIRDEMLTEVNRTLYLFRLE